MSSSIACRKRARTTVEDFVLSYFPLHGLAIEEFFKYWDVLVFVEAAVYEMDEENELTTLRALGPARMAQVGVAADGERLICEILKEQKLLNNHIQLQLMQGKLYWQRERHLCSLLAKAAPADSRENVPKFTIGEVHAASEGKSFDYRLLNQVLYSLRKEEPDKDLMDFLFIDEHLVDIGDDLLDYEEDVLKNSFNIYRAYVHLYGKDAELQLVERISRAEECHREALGKLPKWMQEAYRRRQRQAASIPGSGKWVFPRPIFDEAAFRAEAALED